jgi:hypothetical protein
VVVVAAVVVAGLVVAEADEVVDTGDVVAASVVDTLESSSSAPETMRPFTTSSSWPPLAVVVSLLAMSPSEALIAQMTPPTITAITTSGAAICTHSGKDR